MDYIYLIISLSFIYLVIDSFFSYKKYKKMKEVCDDFNVLSSDYFNLLSDRDDLQLRYDVIHESYHLLKRDYSAVSDFLIDNGFDIEELESYITNYDNK